MAYDVKLDVITIQLRDGKKDKFFGFDNFYTDSHNEDEDAEKKRSFNELFTEYIKSFNNRFMIHTKSGKALNIHSDNVRYNSRFRMIRGLIEGGTSGIGSKIKKVDKINDADAFQVSKDDIDAIPFYFLIWMPSDSNLGLIIVQSLGGKSITDIFKAHFRRFVSEFFEETVHVVLNDLVPKKLIEETKKDGTIDTVIFRRLHLPSDKAEKILGLKYKGQDIKVEVKISGLEKVNGTRDKIMDVISGKTAALFDVSSMSEIGMDGQHETIVKFEHNGKTAQGKSSNEFKLSPSYYVAESDIKRNEHNHPTLDSINAYCVSFLEAMKKEINYKPVQQK